MMKYKYFSRFLELGEENLEDSIRAGTTELTVQPQDTANEHEQPKDDTDLQ